MRNRWMLQLFFLCSLLTISSAERNIRKDRSKDTKIESLTPTLDISAEFLPRAVTYLSHLFPLRDDTTTFLFGRNEKASTKENFFNVTNLGPLFKEALSTAEDAVTLERPFWRDIPTHQHEEKFMDMERLASFHLSNPALRKTEYNKERCENENFHDFRDRRIIQNYVERGLPFEVPCYSCMKKQTGLTTVFYLLPHRNFLDDLELHEKREAFSTRPDAAIPISSWLLHQIKNYQNSDQNKYEAQFVFGAQRAAGGHTAGEFQKILGDDTGRLQINAVNDAFIVNLSRSPRMKDRLNVYEKFYGGLTLICAQLVDNEPRSLGFVYNIDYLVNDYDGDKFFERKFDYDQYEYYNSSAIALPFTSTTTNIKIDISWEDWSCCSACCCSVALCGLYSNAKKCDELDSYRTRRGFLSFFLLDPDKPIEIANKTIARELSSILSLSPYREKGIAIFSSFFLRTPRFKEGFYDTTLKEIMDFSFETWFGVPFKEYKGVGMFIQEEDCAGMEQKMNCSVLAACRGHVIKEPTAPVQEIVPIDPCAEIPLVTLSISESSSSFRFEPNISYRLRLDGVDMEAVKAIKWKIKGDTVPAYDGKKQCEEQGIVVHENGVDLIIIDTNASQVVGETLEAFAGKHRFKINFLVDKIEEKTLADHRAAIKIAGVLGGCASTVLATITIVHNFLRKTKPPPMTKNQEGRARKPQERQT